ncbi:hypothetical protein J6590_028625 [Homalodisca vitripennis]|nr:hypothetical protein J6590_028625 [Homalodisca vitripennis]
MLDSRRHDLSLLKDWQAETSGLTSTTTVPHENIDLHTRVPSKSAQAYVAHELPVLQTSADKPSLKTSPLTRKCGRPGRVVSGAAPTRPTATTRPENIRHPTTHSTSINLIPIIPSRRHITEAGHQHQQRAMEARFSRIVQSKS